MLESIIFLVHYKSVNVINDQDNYMGLNLINIAVSTVC